ncbi:MAG: tetratricopeptide repeat protein, partial [candidate division KSB1 bacterium]|nr:tetratricopeptide repeat protein [candidate division KSB1 bacterium]
MARIEQKSNAVVFEGEISLFINFLQHIRGFALAFAVYHTVAERETIVNQIQNRLPYAFEELFLTEQKRDVIDHLRQVFAECKEKTRALFVYDLEKTFPDSLISLNLKREALQEMTSPIVFWVREFAVREIAEKAPDFWAWRSEVFDFRQAPAESLLFEAVTRVFGLQKKKDLERRIILLQELIEKAKENPPVNLKNIAYLHNQLGLLYHQLAHYDRALTQYQQGLTIRREIGDRAGEGATLNNISQIYDARGDYETALKYLSESLSIRREIGDRAGEGATLNNIGQIYTARGDYETALKYFSESLSILREIGDRAGEGA